MVYRCRSRVADDLRGSLEKQVKLVALPRNQLNLRRSADLTGGFLRPQVVIAAPRN